MLSFREMSVRRKLMLIIMIISMVSLLVASMAFLTSDRLYARKNIGDSLGLMADVISANSAAALLFGDPVAAAETLSFLEAQRNIQACVIYDSNGEIFASYQQSGFTEPAPELQADNLLLRDNHVELFTGISYQHERVGTIYLRSDLKLVQQRLLWFLGIVAAVLATSLLVAFTLSEQLQHIITTPILRLSSVARRISTERNYSLRVQGGGRDELGSLIVDFNTMLDEIEARDARLEQYSAELEGRVAQRTRELEIANRELATSKHEAEQVARHMEYHAHHDSLTGLPNRNLLNDRIRTELAHARRGQTLLAVLFLDLDRFKLINDSLGHATGDQLLCTVSRRLQECLRECDTVARLGGDEFMILLPRISSTSDAGRIASKIISTLVEPMSCSGHDLHVTTSIGISIFPFDGADPETLVKHADISMYRAKELGRNKIAYFTADMNNSSRRRLTLESCLRKALDNDEFTLHYLPKINIELNRVTGFEALLRWHNPTLGQVAPHDFIPVAEESGLFWRVGEWLIHSALRQLREWQLAGFPDLTMAVNLSATQLVRPGLESILENAMTASDIRPQCVELEVTERMIIKNIESAIATLFKLKSMGTSVVMDDFGTGYSSLGYLRKLPIDTVKLDQSFVGEIPDNKEDALIAQAIIAMTRSLNMELVVEGIENVSQLAFFRHHGCRFAQGFLFSSPLPADEIPALLASRDWPGTMNLVG